jgi:hypothetical protein
MSAKRLIIISTTILLILLLSVGGIRLYNKLSYNKQAHTTDIYTFIPPDVAHIVRINNSQGLQDTHHYDSAFVYITDPLKKYVTYPMLFLSYSGDQILMTKIIPEYEEDVKEIIGSQITSPPYAKERIYKDAKLLFYALPDGQFIVCSFHKGIFTIGRNYRLIEKVIDTQDNIYIYNKPFDESAVNIKRNYPSDVFVKSDSITAMLGLNVVNDTLILEGSADKYYAMDEDKLSNIILTDASHHGIARIDTTQTDNAISMKVLLNKKAKTTFNN